MARCECIPTFRHVLTIEKPAETQNAYGEPTRTWSMLKTVRGEIKPLGGTERIVALQTQAAVTHRVRLRYEPQLTAQMRFIFEGRVFNILPPLNQDESDHLMDVLCQEVIDGSL